MSRNRRPLFSPKHYNTCHTTHEWSTLLIKARDKCDNNNNSNNSERKVLSLKRVISLRVFLHVFSLPPSHKMYVRTHRVKCATVEYNSDVR